MQFDKEQVLDLLRSRGDDAKAQEADSTLPDKVDPEQHADLLAKLGINPQDLISKLGGLGGLGGSLGGLGG
jgi:hypothetical protein